MRPLPFLAATVILLAAPSEASAATNPIAAVLDWSAGAVFAGISYIILTFSNFILYIAGTLFNWVIAYTVFGFANIIGGTVGIVAAWSVLRDIANIALLFGFIFIGVATILDIHGYEAKKTLPRLVIFAVLLNFSLLASQVVIDTSNIFSAAIYQQAGGEKCETVEKNCANNGISGKILSMTGVAGIFDTKETKAADDTSFTRLGITYLMMSVFVTITAVVLLAGAIMLIIRAVVLIFLMVLSPIGFAGLAIPPLEKYARDWWDKLLSQSFFAPVFLLLILVSIKVAEGIQGAAGNAGLVQALTSGQVGTIQSIVLFAIFIGFMILSLVAAKQIGAMGAGFAANASSAVVYGSMAHTANFAAGGSAYLARTALQKTGTKHPAARALVNYGLKPLEKTNLDMRRIPGMASVLGAAGITAGAKPSEHATFGDMKHMYQDVRGGALNKRLNAEYDEDQAVLRLEKEAHDPGTALSSESLRHLAGMSTKELEALHGIQDGLEKLAYNLSPEQFEALMKSDKLTDGQRSKLSESRFAALSRAANAAADQNHPNPTQAKADLKRELNRVSKNDLENHLPSSLLDPGTTEGLQILANLSEKQREDVANAKKRTATEKDNVRNSSPVGVIESTYRANGGRNGGAQAVSGLIRTLTVAQIGQLDKEILAQPEIAEQLTAAALIELQEKKKLSVAEMTTIGNNIRRQGSRATQETKNFVTTGPGAALWS